jgi:hypothetical protein
MKTVNPLLKPNPWVFLAVAFAGAWAIEIGFRPYLPFVVRAAIAMLMPGISAWLVRGPLLREGYGDAGLSLNLRQAWKVYLVAYLMIPVLVCVGLLLVTSLGHQNWGLQSIRNALDAFGAASLPTNVPDRLIPMPAVVALIASSLSIGTTEVGLARHARSNAAT